MAKKIKKVETPIDQRETFVSLQKNFADSELSVEEKLKVLYDLQKADVAIDKIIQLRGELPDEVEALENEVADLKAKVAQETEVIDKFKFADGDRDFEWYAARELKQIGVDVEQLRESDDA